jgi:8-oxo-dGTP diphosphatase
MNLDNNRLNILYERVKSPRGERVVKVAINRDNKILLLRGADKLWELPGGHVDSGEEVLAALKREVKEETNLKIDIDIVQDLSQTKDGNKHTKWYRYHDQSDKKVKISDEHIDHKWVSYKKIDKYKLSPMTNKLAIISSFYENIK